MEGPNAVLPRVVWTNPNTLDAEYAPTEWSPRTRHLLEKEWAHAAGSRGFRLPTTERLSALLVVLRAAYEIGEKREHEWFVAQVAANNAAAAAAADGMNG